MSPMAHASWMDQIDAALSSVSDLLFSWVLMWLLVGAGIFFTIRTRGGSAEAHRCDRLLGGRIP